MNPDSNIADPLWYYAIEQTLLGPIPFVKLELLLQSGVITPETLIARNGREDWQPLSLHLPRNCTETGPQSRQISPEGEDSGEGVNGRKTAPALEPVEDTGITSPMLSLRDASKEDFHLASGALKRWLIRGAAAYACFVVLFLLASWTGSTGGFFTLIFLGSWAAMTAFLLGRKKSKILAIGSGFIVACLTPLASGVLLLPFTLSGEKETITGITYAQIVANGLGDAFEMERSSDVDGRPRYMGQTNPSVAVLEIQGDKSDIFKASLILGIPKDSSEVVFKNTVMAMRFLANADSTWESDSRNEWMRTALDRITAGGEKEVTLERGRIRYSLTNMFPLGFSVSLQSKAHDGE